MNPIDRLETRILVVMHDWLAPPGVLGERIFARGATYATRLPHEGYSSDAPAERRGLPDDAAGFDGLIVLGGAMQATDDAKYPHFSALMRLIRECHAARKPVLGVCLGAQLIARAFEARVFAQGWTEYGFAPVTLAEAARTDPLLQGLPPRLRLMQWHEDAFDLPHDAVLLATGEACRNQIFRLGESTYGFQCHLEVNADIARSWVHARRHWVAAHDPAFFARFEHDLNTHLAHAMAFGRMVGDRWLDLVEARRRERRGGPRAAVQRVAAG